MIMQKNIVFVISICLTWTSTLQTSELETQIAEAIKHATVTYTAFLEMFNLCTHMAMPKQKYKMDNLKGFINYPSRTTVGLAPQLTGNRKFFANVVATSDFKQMLNKDAEEIWNDFQKKLKYCDNVIMNQDFLKDYYVRDIDSTHS